jgi:uroporphyrinogen-III synthase
MRSEPGNFSGLRIASFESRQAGPMERLILKHGGVPLVAPSMREVPIEENTDAIQFARELFDGRIDIVIFLTGVGTRALAAAIETEFKREQLVEALSGVVTVARGPKPVAALRELGVPVSVTVPEPNTWRELVATLDKLKASIPLDGRSVAVQEYGVQNSELVHALQDRGANVRRVPVYRWALPTDTGPLRSAIEAIVAGKIDVALFTTSVQVIHLMQLAREMELEPALRESLQRMFVASIGPTTTETLKEYLLPSDLEPSHPKMAILVKEAAEHAQEIIQAKRA